MIMCRELTEEEIKTIALSHTVGRWAWNGTAEFWVEDLDYLTFAKALFEAARVQQTTERTNDKG